MKAFLVSILFFYFAISAIGQNIADTRTTGMNGNWSLLEFKNLASGQIADTSGFQNGWETFYKHVNLNFQYYDTSGEIYGQSFCNGIGGYYKIYGKSKIKASSLGGTKVDCNYESKLWDSFRTASSYKRNNDTLFILYNNDMDEMVFIPCHCQVENKFFR